MLRNHYYRVLQLGGFDETNLVQTSQTYTREFAVIYPAIYAEESVSCATGRIYQPTARPSLILLDVGSNLQLGKSTYDSIQPYLEVYQTIRKVSGNVIPILAWNSASPNFILRFCGPKSLGGLGHDIPARVEALARETGKPIEGLLEEVRLSAFIFLIILFTGFY